MSLLLGLGLGHGSNFPKNASVDGFRSRLSRFATTHADRKQRNVDKPKEGKEIPESVREFRVENPDGHGFPRRYKLVLDESSAEDNLLPSLKSISLVFGRFGRPDGWLTLDGHKIGPLSLKYHQATKTYTFQTTVSVPVDGEPEQIAVSGCFCFDAAVPQGSLHVGERVFAASLMILPVTFNVEVSANAGVTYSSSKKKLSWDTGSNAWKNATWDASVKFSYRTVRNDDDDIEPVTIIENYFTDKSSNPATEFNLVDPAEDNYECIVKDNDGNTLMETTVEKPKDAPDSRKNKAVKSVFPSLFNVNFSPVGDTFAGAYKVKDDYYAIRGTADDELDDDDDYGQGSSSLLSALASRKNSLPAQDIFSFLDLPDDADEGEVEVGLVNEAAAAPASPKSSNNNLDIASIVGNNTMISNKDDPSGLVDAVAQAAMKDFYDIMVYYMDDDLRQTFISSTPISLIPEVKSIADSDRQKNSVFYKKLQVPYITAMLGASTVPEGKYCNRVRAENLLKIIPVGDAVYESQCQALYRFRYLEKFPDTKMFLQDQSDKNYDVMIDRISTQMKKNLDESTKDMGKTNPNFPEDLKKAKADIDRLGKWAKDRKLYWAYRLLYYTEKITLPKFYMQYRSGALGPSIGIDIKNFNALFGILENNRINTATDGTNFMGAFNNMLRVFQMTSLVPQLVDLDGSWSDFDSILKACLKQFWEKYKDSGDAKLADQANLAKELHDDDQLRKNFCEPLKKVARLGGSYAAWNVMLDMWEELVVDTKWFKLLRNGGRLIGALKHFAGAALVMLPLLPGMWKAMSTTDKVSWGVKTAALAATISLKVAQGVVRLAYLWKDISTWKDAFKCALGSDFMGNMAPAANRISSTFARFFTRTASQTARMSMIEAEVALSEKEASHFSRLSRMFGRNMGEILGSVVGITLAAVSLVLTAISLSKEHDPLLIASDILFILAASIQILSFVAGWVLASGIALVAGWVSALTLVSTWGGPVAMAFAVIGIIILIVWMATSTPKNPVQKFIDDRVTPAGLYMQHSATIDYFGAIAATSKTASREGVSIKGSSTGNGNPASVDEQVHLRLAVEDKKKASVDYTKELDFTTGTVWSLRTDGYGRSQIFTQKMITVTDEYGSKNRVRTLWYLSATDDEKSICARSLPNKAADPQEYKKQVKFTQWIAEVVAEPQLDPDSKTAVNALVDISYKTSNDLTKYFALQSDPVKKKPTKFVLVDNADTTSSMRYISRWQFELESLGPVPFEYSKNPWTLFLTNTDERNPVIFEDSEAISSGYNWSISPSLNQHFELLTSPAGDEGIIQIKKGSKLEMMSKTKFTVTCELLKHEKSHGKEFTTVEIEVVNEKDVMKPDDS